MVQGNNRRKQEDQTNWQWLISCLRSVSSSWLGRFQCRCQRYDFLSVTEMRSKNQVSYEAEMPRFIDSTYFCKTAVIRFVPNPDLQIVTLALLPRPRSDMLRCILPIPKTVERETFDQEQLLVCSPRLGEDGVGVLLLTSRRVTYISAGMS